MKALVTGGTGFIGAELITRLRERGDDVVCVAKDRLNSAYIETLGTHVVLGDLNNGVAWDAILPEIDIVFHVAGVTRARTSQEYYEGNYLATKRFVEVCAANCPELQRFVYVSSLSAVGPSLDGQPVTEDSPYHPVSHYGKSKMMGETEVLKRRDKIPVTIIRPSAVYGPRERDMFEYMRLIMHGLQPLIGFRRKLLSLIHSRDLVEGMLLASGNHRAEGETYFLGSEQAYTTSAIGSAIALAVHRHPIRVRLPHALVYAVGAIAESVGKLTKKQVFFNLQKAGEAVQSAWTCSVEKAKTQLGFQQHIALEDGMAQTYRWYCENGWLAN